MTTLEHYGTKGMKLGKKKSYLYLSTPEGRDKLATAENRVRDAYKR